KDDNHEDFLRKRASQLSVGQAQRVLIAMAIMHRPALLIADEATSALDVITQSEILELFGRLNREIGMSILYISHDLPSVAGICHRIAILHEGQIVECGETEQTTRNHAPVSALAVDRNRTLSIHCGQSLRKRIKRPALYFGDVTRLPFAF